MAKDHEHLKDDARFGPLCLNQQKLGDCQLDLHYEKIFLFKLNSSDYSKLPMKDY